MSFYFNFQANMKFMRLLLSVFVLFVGFTAFITAPGSDAVVGTWETAGPKKGHVQIYEKGGTFFGKLVKIEDPTDPGTGKPKLDRKNPNASKQSRPLLGLPIMYNFRYDGENVWSDGKIYDPENGKEYNCKMSLKDPNTLEVRGYIGISLLGRTQTWTRVN